MSPLPTGFDQYPTYSWIHIFITVIVVALIIFIIVLILNHFSPFMNCKDKPDNETIQVGNKVILQIKELNRRGC